jgi:hypothetical protein
MSADEPMTPAVRAARLLERGPVALPSDSAGRRLRARGRAALLLLTRPQARYQREVDEAIVEALRRVDTELARHTEQLEYIEDLVRELVVAAESLRRAVSGKDAE